MTSVLKVTLLSALFIGCVAVISPTTPTLQSRDCANALQSPKDGDILAHDNSRTASDLVRLSDACKTLPEGLVVTVFKRLKPNPNFRSECDRRLQPTKGEWAQVHNKQALSSGQYCVQLYSRSVLAAHAAFRIAAPTQVPKTRVNPQYRCEAKEIDEELANQMKQSTWRQGCPVPLRDLRVLTIRHYDMTGAVVDGQLIVHHDVVSAVRQAFQVAFDTKFPIEKMVPIHRYGGSDDRSVADNNTSAFNCRPITGKKGGFSKHSYGRAIDINPRINPYVTRRRIIPPSGKEYTDRSKRRPGMLFRDSPLTQFFLRRGWKWGGVWRRIKDYQHFEFTPRRRR